MNPINALGIKVAALTGTLMLVLASVLWGSSYLWQQRSQEALVATNTATPDANPDSDGDGLPDRFEAIYRTDPTLADSDNDGMTDYDEIAAGKDPAIAGIQDESKPATGDAVVAPQNYTERYLAELPTDAPRDDILDQTKLESFISTTKGALLTPPTPSTIKTTAATGKEVVATYLNAISAGHNPELAVVNNDDIQQAFIAAQQSNPGPLESIINKLDQNIRVLRTAEAPAEAIELHTKLLSASEALLRNTQLLAGIRDDFVGSLVGSKNIEELGSVFQDIASQISALETKYNLQ